jgi:hypothetical protein
LSIPCRSSRLLIKQRAPGASDSGSDITIVPRREVRALMAAFAAKLAGFGVKCGS